MALCVRGAARPAVEMIHVVVPCSTAASRGGASAKHAPDPRLSLRPEQALRCLYENVRFLGIRTFDAITEFSSGLVNGYLEIEAIDGLRLLIPQYGIQLMCEHGAEPAYRLLRRWASGTDY